MIARRVLARLSPLDCFREQRFWRYSLLPVGGALAHAGLVVAQNGPPPALWATAVAYALGRTVPFLLFVRRLDRGPDGPFRLRLSRTALVTSGACFLVATFAGVRQFLGHPVSRGLMYPALLTGLVAGVLAAVPARDLAGRARRHRGATGLTVVALLPYVYSSIAGPLWERLSPLLTWQVVGLLSLLGIDAEVTWYEDRHFGWSALVRSDRWEMQLASGCSEFAVIVYFVAGFAGMILLRPARASRPVAALAALAVGLTGVIGINAVRLATLVDYAGRTIRSRGRTEPAYELIEAYHRSGGPTSFVVALAFFAAYFWLTSRFLDRVAGPSSDRP